MTLDQLMLWIGPVSAAVVGWFLKELWSSLDNLRDDIQTLERSMPNSYVLKSDYHIELQRVYETLSRIEKKLDEHMRRAP